MILRFCIFCNADCSEHTPKHKLGCPTWLMLTKDQEYLRQQVKQGLSALNDGNAIINTKLIPTVKNTVKNLEALVKAFESPEAA